MSELKTRPFCGSVDHLVNEEGAATIVCSVHTGGCGASTGYVKSDKKHAIELWNTRAPDTSAKVERLQRVVDAVNRKAYLSCQTHLSGGVVSIGYSTLKEAQDATMVFIAAQQEG